MKAARKTAFKTMIWKQAQPFLAPPLGQNKRVTFDSHVLVQKRNQRVRLTRLEERGHGRVDGVLFYLNLIK